VKLFRRGLGFPEFVPKQGVILVVVSLSLVRVRDLPFYLSVITRFHSIVSIGGALPANNIITKSVIEGDLKDGICFYR
jgi:hypothetical protein